MTENVIWVEPHVWERRRHPASEIVLAWTVTSLIWWRAGAAWWLYLGRLW